MMLIWRQNIEIVYHSNLTTWRTIFGDIFTAYVQRQFEIQFKNSNINIQFGRPNCLKQRHFERATVAPEFWFWSWSDTDGIHVNVTVAKGFHVIKQLIDVVSSAGVSVSELLYWLQHLHDNTPHSVTTSTHLTVSPRQHTSQCHVCNLDTPVYPHFFIICFVWD